MKKFMLIILSVLIILVIGRFLSVEPTLRGFYQSDEVNGYFVQMLFREKDNSFVEWISNREVDRGTYTKIDTNLYIIKSNKQSVEITLNGDNSFEIPINKLNEGNPISMKNISLEDHGIGFGSFDDVEEYKSMLD
jgi:hypothetical protein